MGEPILIFFFAVAGTLSYAYVRQLIYNKRQRQLQMEQRGNRREVLVVSGRSNTNTTNQAIPPKYEDVVDTEEQPPNYNQAVLNI